MPELCLLTDLTTDLQFCKWIPSGIRHMPGPFFLLSSHALFRDQIRYHVRCQQLLHLQRLPLVFTLSSQLSSPVHQESAPALSAFSLNPFPLHNCAAAYLWHLCIYGHSHHFTRRPLCASTSYLCCDILLQPPPAFTQQMSLLSPCSNPSQCKFMPGLQEESYLTTGWQKGKILSPFLDTSSCDAHQCTTQGFRNATEHTLEFLQMLQLCGIWVKSSVDILNIPGP